MALKNHMFYGMKLSLFSLVELRHEIINTIENCESKVFYGYSLGFIPFIKNYPGITSITNSFDVMVTDGRLFYLLARLFGAPLKYDISIPNLTNLIFEIANEKKYSVMLIGSTKETNEKASENIRKKYLNMTVFNGIEGGDFSKKYYEEIVNHINKKKPDIICVGVSTPKKEHFVFENKLYLETKIIVPFGGMIDGLAGNVLLTPLIIKKIGLATFIRLFQEPKRLARITLETIYETIFRIIPRLIWEVKIKRNNNFSILDIYKKQKNQ